ncbi:MAG: DUF692 domain-containing protein [Salibacteraceae bacterium]
MSSKIGIGFRRDLATEMISVQSGAPNFIEVAPENWMDMGGYWKSVLDKAVEKYPLFCHGLSLSIGGPDEVDIQFVKNLKSFLDEYNVEFYSEHLSFSQCDNAHLYDLLPIPFRQDAVDHIVAKIKKVQDILERPLILENVSYYTPVAAEMSEIDFVKSIIDGSGCKLLLDVNNVYVNAFNHQYDAKHFIDSMPLEKVAYIHMAGHEKVKEDLIIDTHGHPIIDPVYELFDWTTQRMTEVPVLLERDFNLPELDDLVFEMNQLRSIADKNWKT